MPDKDDFTFDDSDDFPDTDLSSAFSDGEHSVPEPDLEEEYEERGTAAATGGGSSRSRILLLVLLMVVAVAAGAYYFMDLGGTTPNVPPAPEKAAKVVVLPPQPASQTGEPAGAAQTVTVPVPVPAQDGETAAKPADATPAAAPQDTTAAVAPSAQKAETAPSEASEKPVAAATVKTEEKVAQAESVPAATSAVPAAVAEKAPLKVAALGAYNLDAGSFLLAGNRDALVKKLRGLGYEPLVTPVDATVPMTRLSLGVFPANAVEEALALARSIEPSSFSVPAGDGFVIYAGTFLQTQNVEALTARFLKEGIRAKSEPIEMKKTLSRVRFGSFTTRDEAEAAAREAGEAGVKSTVVKGR